MQILIAVNAHSRRGRDPLDPAVRILEQAGHSVTIEKGTHSSDIGPIIERCGSMADVIVLAGGDGTLNAAAPALLKADRPVGILPLGTANDLAATLGIPTDLTAAARIVAEGYARRIDVGEVNGHPFFNVASIGFSVSLTRSLSAGLKRRWGSLAYAVAGVKALPRLRHFKAEIVASGRRTDVRTIQIAVGNGRTYGGGSIVSENAHVDDGCLDLYSIETTNPFRLALLSRAFRKGRHGRWPEVRTLRAPSFEVRTPEAQAVEADGKILTKTPARFALRPRALSVFVPP